MCVSRFYLEAVHLESHLRDLLCFYCTIPLENAMEEFPIVTKTVNRSLVFELQCVRITSPEAFETNPIKVFSRAQYQHITNFDPQSIHNPNLSFQLSLSAKNEVFEVWSVCFDTPQGWIFACASASLPHFLEGLEGEEPPYNLILIERARASHDDSTFKNIGCGGLPNSSEALKRHTDLSIESDQRHKLSGEPSD